MCTLKAADWQPKHFKWQVANRVATITLNRPERKNPLTFETYAELRDTFRALRYATDVQGGRAHRRRRQFLLGRRRARDHRPARRRWTWRRELLAFTRMTGDLVKAMRACPQPIVAAIDGVCAGAGAILAMASDLRFGTARSKIAFLFVRVGLAGADMGACAHPAAHHRAGHAPPSCSTPAARWTARKAERWGFYNRLVDRRNAAGARRERWRSRWPTARRSRTR